MSQLPKIENYLASNGTELRSLFVVAVLRALTPYERKAVFTSIYANELNDTAKADNRCD
jgi:hypothetical protein